MTTPRRERLWVDRILNIQVGTTASISPIDLLKNLDDAKTKITVVRQLIDLVIYPDNMGETVDGAQSLNLGIGVVSKEAMIADVVPDPATDTDYPRDGWMWVATAIILNQQSAVGEYVRPAHYMVDSRSQRVVDRGDCFLAADNSVSSGVGFTLRIAGRVRSLVLL